MPSFDAVSQIDMQELDNALNQAKKEVGSRYDFQGTSTELALAEDKKTILIRGNSVGRLEAAADVLLAKLAKRGISLRSLERGKVEPAQHGHVKQTVKLLEGINIEKAKQLVKVVKDSKIKVQASIQGDVLRCTGKNRDDLQEAMALLRQQQEPLDIDLQFKNFRD
jgi:uncharacterized protein YajQ (UPF0234 family)